MNTNVNVLHILQFCDKMNKIYYCCWLTILMITFAPKLKICAEAILEHQL